MIEQEKAVQFRFDTIEKSLFERLKEIGLPAYARLFSCIGLPNVFAWKNAERTESFQETWLYIPDRTLEEITNSQNIRSQSDEKIEPAPYSFVLDNYLLYAIYSGGKCGFIIAVPDGKAFDTSQIDLGKLEKIERTAVLMDKSDAIQIAFEFVSRLYDCKQNYAAYAQRLLTFLTDQVDKSYAGLYWQGPDGFHRRWAYGDLQLSDKLPLNAASETVDKWRAAHSHGRTFIPAELVHDEPVFVQTPPSFLFVCETPHIGDREQWLVMAVPGDVTGAAMTRINIIASLLSAIDDDRSTGYSELVNMFGELLNKEHKMPSLEEALKNCFKLIDSKLILNSLCLLDSDRTVSRCLKKGEDQFEINRTKVAKIPDRAWAVMESFEPAFFEGPSHPLVKNDATNNTSGVSHSLYPIPLYDGAAALLSSEFTSKLERARRHQRLFELAAVYLGLCLSLGRKSTIESRPFDLTSSEQAQSVALARLKTISKINGGYFHELTEFLSVILGQAEIMEYAISKSAGTVTAAGLLLSADRIVRATSSLASRLEELKDVSTIRAIDGGNFIGAEEFLKMLPSLTYGYILTVRDNKNVETSVQTKTDRNVSFSIPALHIYDYILPLILAIMDEALCSGKIVTSITEHFGRPALRISFPKKLLGKTSLDKLIPKVFIFQKMDKGTDGSIIIAAENAQFVFSDCDGDRYQAIYTLVNVHHPIEEY